MLKPNERTVPFLNGTAVAEVRVEPTDLPYDGDDPKDVEGCEGFDVLVRVRFTLGQETWTGRDSLGGIWIKNDREGRAYLNSEIDAVTQEALSTLRKSMEEDAKGIGVAKAKDRATAARRALKGGR